jgi:heterodisulfide reductase subunit A
LDLEALGSWAGQRGDIASVETHDLFCSPAGKEAFKKALAEKRPERVVVAACSPKMHEKTFQDLAEEAGLNISQVQMANIREQCAWVTRQPERALSKAKALVNAAIKRGVLSETLTRQTMDVRTDVLVIGGGIAGIEAALTAARAGRKVTIVDRDISLGGAAIRTEEVAPVMECSPCLLSPRLADIRDDPNIEVVANAEVTAVLGFYGNFTARIHRRARYVNDTCIGCEACFEACPVDVPSRFHLGLGTHKAIHTLFPGSVPAAAVIDREHCLHFKDGSCDACVAACPFGSIDFEEQDEQMEIEVGAIVVATGFASGDVSAFPELGYGQIEEVYTLGEFDRLASNNGPTGSEIRRKDGRPPERVAVIHCAGSLRDDGIAYCSGTCCTDAVKVGALVRAQLPEVEVYDIHRDLVFAGPGQHRFYERARAEGTRFVRCEDLRSVKVTKKNGNLQVTGSGFDPLEVDMVVLANGLKPAEGTPALAGMLDIELTEDGYFMPDHSLLHATGASRDGIYVAGCAAGPCDLSTSVTQGRSAVGDAISKLLPGRKIDLEVMTSVIDPEVCAGCKLCLSVCPYKAITFDAERQVCVVNEAICRGCGTCTAGCPSGASRAKHFTDEQIYAEIGGLLNV